MSLTHSGLNPQPLHEVVDGVVERVAVAGDRDIRQERRPTTPLGKDDGPDGRRRISCRRLACRGAVRSSRVLAKLRRSAQDRSLPVNYST